MGKEKRIRFLDPLLLAYQYALSAVALVVRRGLAGGDAER